MASLDIRLPDSLVEFIIKFLDERTARTGKRNYPIPLIYADNEAKIKEFLPGVEVDKYNFQKALSVALKEGRLPGYQTNLGKAGGVGKAKPVEPEAKVQIVEKEVKTIVEKLVEERSSLEYEGKTYTLTLSTEKLVKLFTKVFRLSLASDEEKEIGNTIIIDGVAYSCPSTDNVNDTLKSQIEDFLFYFSYVEPDND